MRRSSLLQGGWSAALVTTLILALTGTTLADDPPSGVQARRVALAALADGGLAIVDPDAGRQLGRIEGLGDATFGIALNPSNPRQAWAVSENAGLLYELDLSTWAIKGRPIDLSGGAGRPIQAHQPAFTPDGRFIVITVPGDDTLTLVHTATRAVSKINVPDRPHIVSVDAATGHAFVSCRGARPSAVFLDLPALDRRYDLSRGVRLGADELRAAGSAHMTIDLKLIPRVITAMGRRRFAVAVYGKRGPLIYQAGQDGQATLVDDLDLLVRERPRGVKANQEYLEAQAVSADGRTLAGTDQGPEPCLRIWTLDADGRGVREQPRILLPLEPYWVVLSEDAKTAWVTLHRQVDQSGREVTGRVLTIDLERRQVTHSVAIDDDGGLHCPKRLLVTTLPLQSIKALQERNSK